MKSHFSLAAMLERARKAQHIETTEAMQRIVATGQPVLNSGLEFLGQSKFGDVTVDLYGTVKFVGTRIQDIYVEDVTVANTAISLESCIGGADWKRFEEEAIDAYERGLTAVTDWRGRVTWN